METGLKWLNETFGKAPTIAWQIDSFGSSAITPSLFSNMGFDTMVMNRIGNAHYS
jgi:alpha-mannosidase